MMNLLVTPNNLPLPNSLDLHEGASRASLRDDALKESAQDFETVFISQMLQYSGLAKTLSQDTGSGSDAFASMHLTHIAENIANAGGFGLQDHIYETLKRNETGS